MNPPRVRKRAPASNIEVLPEGIRPQYLSEEFKSTPPKALRGEKGSIGKLALVVTRYILWAKCEGMGASVSSTAVGISLSTADSLLSRAKRDPGIFIDCRFIHRVRLGRARNQNRWWCRFCGEIFRGPSPAADHAWAHAFNKEDNF